MREQSLTQAYSYTHAGTHTQTHGGWVIKCLVRSQSNALQCGPCVQFITGLTSVCRETVLWFLSGVITAHRQKTAFNWRSVMILHSNKTICEGLYLCGLAGAVMV